MNKHKLLFVGLSLKVGGVERALVEQVNALDTDIYDVDLMLFSKTGAYVNDINPGINVIGDYPLLRILAMTQSAAKNEGGFCYLIRSFFALIAKIIGSPALFRFIFRFIKPIGPYDAAISFFHDGSLKSLYYGCNLFVASKVSAARKIAWIHSDYVGCHLTNPHSDSLIKSFDAVVNVSYAIKQKFDTLQLLAPEKSFVVYNRLHIPKLMNKSKEECFEIQSGSFIISSVCRLEREKGVDQLLHIALELKQAGLQFSWYFLGMGVLFEWCQNYISDHGLERYVFLLGQKDNPYPYIKKSDLFVSGSLSETFGLSIVEALILKVPVVALKYDAIAEILSEENGVVCNSFEEMGNTLFRMISDKSWYMKTAQKVHSLTDYNKINEQQFTELLMIE